MCITLRQTHVIMNLLVWMAKTKHKLGVTEEPINKPKILQHGLNDKFCRTPVQFIFTITNPKQTFDFLNENLQLSSVLKSILFHKDDIITCQSIDAKNWSWPHPCKYMATSVGLALEDALDHDVASLKSMGLSYQGEFINGQRQGELVNVDNTLLYVE